MNHRDDIIIRKIISEKVIPWKEVAGFRDIAAHKYNTLKMESVYQTILEDFPILRQR